MRKGNLLSPQDRAIYEHPEKQVAPVIFVYGGTRVSSGGFCSGESFVLERYSVVQRTGRTGGSNDDFDSDTESQANEINNNPKSPAGSRPGSPSPDGVGSSPGLASPCSPGRASTRNLAFADSSENGPPGSPGSKSRGGAGRTAGGSTALGNNGRKKVNLWAKKSQEATAKIPGSALPNTAGSPSGRSDPRRSDSSPGLGGRGRSSGGIGSSSTKGGRNRAPRPRTYDDLKLSLSFSVSESFANGSEGAAAALGYGPNGTLTDDATADRQTMDKDGSRKTGDLVGKQASTLAPLIRSMSFQPAKQVYDELFQSPDRLPDIRSGGSVARDSRRGGSTTSLGSPSRHK